MSTELGDTPAPPSGSPGPRQTGLAPEEEPVTTGTVFLTIIILTIIGAVWGVAYYLLLSR